MTTPTASLLINGEQTFVDANGKPLAAGTVGFYIPGTLTPKTTWGDPLQATPNTNPVVLDGAGRCIAYGSGQYRQIVKDVLGNVIWDQLTQDLLSLYPFTTVSGSVLNVSALRALSLPNAYSVVTLEGYYSAADGGGGDFAIVTGQPAGTYVDNGGTIFVPTGGNGSAAYLRMVPNGPINVRWFGAKGDGVTNDRSAIFAADNFAASINTATYVPYGTYVIATGGTLTRDIEFDLGGVLSLTSGTLTFSGNVDAASNIAIFQGAGTYTLPNQRTPVYAEWWGAKADLSVDAGPMFNAAQTALTNGGTIQGNNGLYQVGTAIVITNKVDINGAGWGLNPSGEGTIFEPSTTFGAGGTNVMLTINVGSSAVRNVNFVGTSGVTVCRAIATGALCGLNTFEHIDIGGFGYGLIVPNGNGLQFRQIRIQAISQVCIYLGGTTGQYPGDISWQEVVTIPNSGGTSVLIDGNTNAMYFHRLECIGGYIGVNIRGAGADVQPGGLFFFDCNITAMSSYGIAVVRAWQVMFYDTWIGGITAGPGVFINAASPSDVDGVLFDGCLIGGNWLHGINYQSGGGLVVLNCQIAGNGQGASNTYDGIFVQSATIGTFQVTGCTIVPYWFHNSGTQNYGIYLNSGSIYTSGLFVGRVLIAGNIIGGAATAAISDNSTPAGAYKVIANNVTS